MRGEGLRLRTLVDDYVQVVVIALLVLLLAGGVLTYTTYVDPATRLETRETASWQSVGEFSHRATVAEDTEPFPEGTVLRNRSVYVRRIAPLLSGSFTYSYTASEGGNLAANATVVLVVRSVVDGGVAAAEDDGEAVELWRVERRLGGARAASLSPGERLRVPFSVNVSMAERRAREIEQQLGVARGETGILVVVRLRLSGTRNGEPVDRTRTYRLPVTVEAGTYRVEDPGRVTDSGGTQEQVAVPATPGPLRRVGAPLLLLLGLGGLAGLATARYRGDLDVSAAEREWLDYRGARDEFDEWITAARLPEAVLDGPQVEVDTLQGLVDLAIDTDRRVIEDAGRGQYYVLGEAIVYTYVPPYRPPGREGSLAPFDATGLAAFDGTDGDDGDDAGDGDDGDDAGGADGEGDTGDTGGAAGDDATDDDGTGRN